jgi:hypothetical protein
MRRKKVSGVRLAKICHTSNNHTSNNLTGEISMILKRDRIAACLFISWLAIIAHAVEAAVLDARGCDYACWRMREKKIDLKDDETDLQSDVNMLRRLLLHHASQQRIDMLRNRIQEDWSQIVMARGLTRELKESPLLDVAEEFFKHIVPRG